MKTISTTEKLVFLNTLLPAYHDRLYSDESALVRVWGVFQVQCVGNYSTNLILMDNVSSSSDEVTAKFDLKGSLYHRRCTERGRLKVGKDSNFLEEVGHLSLVPEDARKLMVRLERDTLMLASHNVMDYSILVTEVHGTVPWGCPYLYRSSKSKQDYYLIALIDFFQQYDLSKKTEKFWKTHVKCGREISTTDSQTYAERFVCFARQISPS
jgi:hypothetical protein